VTEHATPRDQQAYWDEIAEQFGTDRQSSTWRAYMQQRYTALCARWFANTPDGPTLKTDLFEEAVTPLHLFGTLGAQAVGTDISLSVVQAASARLSRERGPALQPPALAVSDLRALPYANDSFARMLSGSSLDHFARFEDIAVALTELARCLRPGGCLVVTFDNPHNPLVRLRNALPFSWLTRVGLVPYFVGATYTRSDALRTLTALGLDVTHVGSMGHVPRAPAIWASDFHARRSSAVSRWLLRCFTLCDQLLDGSAVQFRTGYYLAIRAVKPLGAATSAPAHQPDL
jgi:SAM-dependent methyltransferase